MLNSSIPATGCSLVIHPGQDSESRSSVPPCPEGVGGSQAGARPGRAPLRGWKAAPGHRGRRSGGRRRQPAPPLQPVTCYAPLSARVPGHRLGLPAARLRSEDAAGSFLGFPDGDGARRCRSLRSVPQSEARNPERPDTAADRHRLHSSLGSRHGGAGAGQGGNSR